MFAKDTYVGFGFRLQNEQSNEAYVLEVDDEAVSLVAVRPGRYHVKSWLTWALLGRDVIMEQAIAESEPIRRSFQIQAGQVILLGEWHAHFERDMRHGTFTLSSVPITEPGAIRMLQEAYPRFADLTVACLHCIP